MGDHKRPIYFVGATGPAAGDEKLTRLTEMLVEQLLPLLTDIAAVTGWAAVLNALQTIEVNVGVRELGAAAVRAAHQRAIEALATVDDLARFERAAKSPPGRA